MSNFQLPMQLIQMIKGGGNPQQMLMGMLQNNMKGNPMMENVMQMANSGNGAGIEQLARNLCKSKGINPDELMSQVQNQFK